MLDKYINDKEVLRNDLISGDTPTSGIFTLIEKPRFDSIDFIKDDIYQNEIQGEIVECGVWKGGMTIYLTYQFPDRKIWVCDSFEGFQPLNIATYEYENERHTENFDVEHGHPFSISISLEEVKANFKTFEADNDNVNYLKGWVKDTLNPKTCNIGEIALLRIDVDAYSATLEVLDMLYDKVVTGGWVVFDDSALPECQDAIKEFKRKRNINFELIYPSGFVGNDKCENGGYFKKI